MASDHSPMRIDDLAREAGVASTTVRLYQNKGLLHGPQVVGRTGFYDRSHLARLRLIGRLQDDGFSLAAITRLLSLWEEGRSLSDLVGVEGRLESLLHQRRAIELSAEELAARFPPDVVDPELIRRAIQLGLVSLTDDGRFRVADERFLTVGADLAALGISTTKILVEWERLATVADQIAKRWIALFEDELLPEDWRSDLTPERTVELADTLERLQTAANQVVAAALDASIAKIGGQRLAELVPDEA